MKRHLLLVRRKRLATRKRPAWGRALPSLRDACCLFETRYEYAVVYRVFNFIFSIEFWMCPFYLFTERAMVDGLDWCQRFKVYEVYVKLWQAFDKILLVRFEILQKAFCSYWYSKSFLFFGSERGKILTTAAYHENPSRKKNGYDLCTN